MGLWSKQSPVARVSVQFGIFAICILFVSGCGMPVVDNKDVKRAKLSPPIPYQQLDPKTSDFQLSLKKAPGYPRPETVAARNKFPTTRDCLIESEKAALEPDLRLIDWKTIRARPELDVCLTRIFRSLGSFQAIKRWLSFHRFKSIGDDPIKNNRAPKPIELLDGKIICLSQFYWEDRLPFRDQSPVPHIVAPKFYIRVSFECLEGKPLGVTSKWQQSM